MPTLDPKVDAYIEKAPPFARPILTKIRAAFHEGCPELVERIKWGVPSFEHEGMLGGMAAFKAHATFGFWKGQLMEDPQGLFGDECKASFMRVKVADVKELPPRKVLVAYVREAKRLNDEGVRLPAAKPGKRTEEDLDVPAELAAALRRNKAAHATWKGFSYTNKKEYAEWIAEAKREATREKRLAQAIEWMAEGKSRNWKYQ